MKRYTHVSLSKDWSKSLGDKILLLYKNNVNSTAHGVFLDTPEESIAFIEKQNLSEIVDILFPQVRWTKRVVTLSDIVNLRDEPGNWIVSFLDPRTTAPLVTKPNISFSQVDRNVGEITPSEFLSYLALKNSSIVNLYPPRTTTQQEAAILTFLRMLLSIRTHMVYAPDMEKAFKLYEKAKREGIKQLGWLKKNIREPNTMVVNTGYTQLLEEIFQNS